MRRYKIPELGQRFREWAVIDILKNARNRNIKVSIKAEDIWNQYIKQDKRCALTGLPINFSMEKSLKSATASLDRIDSSIGYTIENIQLVLKAVNIMKMALPQERFVMLCGLVAAHSEKYVDNLTED